MKNIAVIGAGLAGLTFANKLKNTANITIFEKARGVSGRLSTRRAKPYHFDHGAPFFKARSQAFKDFLSPLITAEVVKRWDGRFVEIDGTNIISRRDWTAELPHYVGAPRMSAMTKFLSQGLDVHLATRVARIRKTDKQWQLFNDEGKSLGEFDWVICTAPAEQSAELIPSDLPMHARIANTTMKGCYALMLGLERPLNLDFEAALVKHSDISWVSVNHTKPDRPDAFALTILSSNLWADTHLDADQDWVQEHLLKTASNTLGHDLSTATHVALHRWRYANVDKQTGEPYLIDTGANIGVCGDWLIRGNVEAAFTSGDALAATLIRHLTTSSCGEFESAPSKDNKSDMHNS